MPRAQRADMLLVNKFHLIDVSVSLPPVLIPVYGFSAITAPELTIEEKTIKEANFEYPRKVFEKASVTNITLTRGTQLQDTDFYLWIDNYILGKREKKNLMLIQSTNIDEGTFNPGSATSVTKLMKGPLGKVPGLKNVVGGVTNMVNVFQVGLKTPGRAWILKNCAPVKYKAASDFDAKETAVSLMELEISYEWFTEINTGLLKS